MIPNNILLLKIIENNGKISLLRDRGLTHPQIAMMIKNLEAEGNILITDDDILLTPKGIEFLENNISRIMPRKKDQWILPQEHLYNTPISFDEIILPKGKKI